MEAVQRQDLEPTLAAHSGNRTFAQTFERITSGEDLLRALGRYIHFNSTFGGGVANLAGEIAVRQDLFRDRSEALEIAADRSVEVAADVFFAAVDEFDDRYKPHRDSHRTLAQATLKAAGRFFGYDPASLNHVVTPNAPTLNAIRKVRDGYGINRKVGDRTLFHGIGFHMGSEILADEEFNILDGFLRRKRPDLVAYLQKAEEEIDGIRHGAYYWIQIHTSVEADHFAFAAKAANRALQYYAGPESISRVKGWILEGFREFSAVQTEFMEGLL